MTAFIQKRDDLITQNRNEETTVEAATWFVRIRNAQNDETDRLEFDRWLSASEAHRREYAHIERLWGALDALSPQSGRQPRSKRRVLAAGLALCALISLTVLQAEIGVKEQSTTRIGESVHRILADGSTIDIDGNTSLRIEYTLLQRKLVITNGQAFFRVAPGLRPFVVVAGDGSLRDIGTSFNVLNDHDRVTVSVFDGAVEVELKSTSEKRMLAGGQQLTYTHGHVSATSAIPPGNNPAWLDNRWIFNNAALGEVVRHINREHERPVTLADSTLEEYRISGVFERSNRSGLLKALGELLPIRVVETREGTQLRRR